MPLRVDRAALERFPGIRLVVVEVSDLDNTGERPEVAAELERAWTAAGRDAAAWRNAQSHPRVRPWRAALGARFPSSIEALLRRAINGGPPPRINPLVDFCTIVSLRNVVPIGAFDLDAVQGEIALRLTGGGEPFHAIGAGQPVAVAPGEIAYTDDRDVLTRHFVWRQSLKGAIRPSTRRAVLLSEILPEIDEPVAKAVRAHLQVGLRRDFAAASEWWILSGSEAG